MTICSGEIPEDDDLNPRHFVYTGYERAQREKTIKYSEQPYAQLSFTPVFDPDVSYESETKYCASPDPIFRSHSSYLDTMEYVYSYDYEELMQQYGYARPVGTGYFTSAPTVVTAEEKEALKKYAEADDMRGFFNYQSRIFKRIIDEIEIDVTATFTDGTEVTKTLELFYTPIDITEREWHNDYWYTDHATYSYSRGTISAKIK